MGLKSFFYGKSPIEETKLKMSLKKRGLNNPLFGKVHKETSKTIMSQKKVGTLHSMETKNKMSKSHGIPIKVYEKNASNNFILLNTYPSSRKAAIALALSSTTINKYAKTGDIFKCKYKIFFLI